MKSYSYSPPTIKHSTALIDVFNTEHEVMYTLKRTYKNSFVKFLAHWKNIDFYTRMHVYNHAGELLYYCQKKNSWFAHPSYDVCNCQTNDVYHVTYTTLLNIAPEFHITGAAVELTMKSGLRDAVQFFHEGKEVARWHMKLTELFKTYLEIDEASPIQDAAFFICVCQCIFYAGD